MYSMLLCNKLKKITKSKKKKKKTYSTPDIDLYLDGVKFTPIGSHSYLELWFSKTMLWRKHIDKTITKASIPSNFLKT